MAGDKDPVQGESIRRLMTLLWILINVTMVCFLITSFFAGKRAPIGLCLDQYTNTSAPTARPTPMPTLANSTRSPTTSAPTRSPTNSSTIDIDDEDDLFYDDGNAGFVVMWSTLLLIVECVTGTIVLKSQRTPFAVGVFAGMSIMMANLMFLLAASSAGELRRRALLDIVTPGDQAILAFTVLEFMLLSAFSIVLVRHKDYVLELQPEMEEVNAREFEPTVNGAGGI